MDLLTAFQVLARRKMLLAAMLAVASACVLGLYWKMPHTYQVSATLLVLQPPKGGIYQPPPSANAKPKPTPTALPPTDRFVNPYLSFDSSSFILAKVIAQSLNSDAERRMILARGGIANYQVTIPADEPALAIPADEPALTITVTGHDRTKETKTLDLLIEDASAQLADRQQATGLPKENWAGFITVLTSDTAISTKQRLTVAGAAGALGLFAAFAVVFVIDSISKSRPVASAAPRVTHLPNGERVAIQWGASPLLGRQRRSAYRFDHVTQDDSNRTG